MSTYETPFWHWLAGLAEGEGCFLIARNNKDTFSTKFSIQLRADDWNTLAYIQENTGFGRLSSYRSTTKNPLAGWEVLRIRDCRAFAEGMRGKLRTKKAADFAIWGEAVSLLEQYGGGRGGANARLAQLKESLSAVKRFSPDAAEAALAAFAVRPKALYEKVSKWDNSQPLPTESIIAEYGAGGVTQTQLANKYGVSVSVINRVILGKYRPGYDPRNLK